MGYSQGKWRASNDPEHIETSPQARLCTRLHKLRGNVHWPVHNCPPLLHTNDGRGLATGFLGQEKALVVPSARARVCLECGYMMVFANPKQLDELREALKR